MLQNTSEVFIKDNYKNPSFICDKLANTWSDAVGQLNNIIEYFVDFYFSVL